MRGLFCVGFALMWGVVGWQAEAAAAWEGAVTQMHHRLKGSPRVLFRAVMGLEKQLSKAQLPASRRRELRSIVACMAALAGRQSQGRYVPWTLSRRRLRRLKRGHAFQLVWMKKQRRRLRLCLHSALFSPMAKKLAPVIDVSRMDREARSLDWAYPALEKASKALLQTAQRRRKIKAKGEARRRMWYALTRQLRGQLLLVDRILARRQKDALQIGLSSHQRARKIRLLWALRSVKPKGPYPIHGLVPLLVQTNLTVVVPCLAVGKIADDLDQNLPFHLSPLSWGAIGFFLGALGAYPALAMVFEPQPLAPNLVITLLSTGLIPLIGLSMALSPQPYLQQTGVGVLSSLPLHAAWLTIGWINQTRWQRIRRRWKAVKPLPARPQTALTQTKKLTLSRQF